MMSVGVLAAVSAWILGKSCSNGRNSNSTLISGCCFWYSAKTALSEACWFGSWTPMNVTFVVAAELAAAAGVGAAGGAWVGLRGSGRCLRRRSSGGCRGRRRGRSSRLRRRRRARESRHRDQRAQDTSADNRKIPSTHHAPNRGPRRRVHANERRPSATAPVLTAQQNEAGRRGRNCETWLAQNETARAFPFSARQRADRIRRAGSLRAR